MVWYPWALDRLGLPWIHVTFRLRNAIEGSFRTLKEGLRGFRNDLNAIGNHGCGSHGQDPGIRIQPPRVHQTLGTPPLGWWAYLVSIQGVCKKSRTTDSYNFSQPFLIKILCEGFIVL
ncbi:hypothetical protein KEJ19_01855 [Candidatus Bathyarchaeota archaeon]|nr:hypothetical protein [Candidatus Bathyarchaeota archaeon]